MPASDWLVGSYPNLPTQTLSVTANAVTEDVTIAAGSYYLHDPAGGRSLVTALQAALAQHSQLPAAIVSLTQGRRVRIVSNAGNITINWIDTLARNLLGFTGNLSGAASYTAPNVSELLWVPDRPGSPASRLGRHGDPVHDTIVSSSGGSDATIVATHHDTRIHNEFDYRYIPFAYYDAGDDGGGQWRTFFDVVVRRFRRLKIYRGLSHTEGSTTAVVLSTFLGPYRYRPGGQPIRYDTTNEIDNVHRMGRARLPVVQVSDY